VTAPTHTRLSRYVMTCVYCTACTVLRVALVDRGKCHVTLSNLTALDACKCHQSRLGQVSLTQKCMDCITNCYAFRRVSPAWHCIIVVTLLLTTCTGIHYPSLEYTTLDFAERQSSGIRNPPRPPPWCGYPLPRQHIIASPGKGATTHAPASCRFMTRAIHVLSDLLGQGPQPTWW
jgi:hypothetical protein